ncbi:Nocturnin [Halocaridina rubra]|uniref:Nocturnin n=1 Tax=Halocaridina rubra TaxID=373956 RepID=A0AAN9AHH6_HALRR
MAITVIKTCKTQTCLVFAGTVVQSYVGDRVPTYVMCVGYPCDGVYRVLLICMNLLLLHYDCYFPKLCIRMGSFTSKPQVESEEGQDAHIVVPEEITRQALLEWIREPIRHLPALLPRAYRLPSKGLTHKPQAPPEGSFRVMQWNVLAQALGTHADNFVMCPPKALEWNTRRYRILEEIITYMPDIICLQEVDHYDVMERVLASQGYKGMFMPKPESPCLFLPNNNGPDGCAVFWDDSKFKLVSKQTRVVEVWHVQSNQVSEFISESLIVNCLKLQLEVCGINELIGNLRVCYNSAQHFWHQLCRCSIWRQML